MALKYVVKKRVFGFDKTKTEKYVAQNVITNTVNFRDLCKEVSMFGMIPEGAVKHVIDALIDALNTNLNKGGPGSCSIKLEQGTTHRKGLLPIKMNPKS